MGFADEINSFVGKTEDKLELAARKIAFEILDKIVLKSPVDTGRFRANNQIALNNLPAGSKLTVDKSGRATLTKGDQVLDRFNVGDTIFIYNNLEYAIPLEYGWSKQAPKGVYRVSVEDVKTQMDKLIRSI